MFCAYSVVYLKEELKWSYLVGFGMMIGAVFFCFQEGEGTLLRHPPPVGYLAMTCRLICKSSALVS